MKKFITLFFVLLVISTSAKADLETDRIAGECAGLLTTLNKPAVAAKALGLADNQNRASSFGLAWLEKAKKYSGDSNMMGGLVYSAASDCRKIGIRSSD